MVQSIKLFFGESVDIPLKSLATAGYFWNFEIEKPGIISIEKISTGNGINKVLAGESLNEIFKIKGIGIGTTKLIFQQTRSWETNLIPVQMKAYQVTIIEQ